MITIKDVLDKTIIFFNEKTIENARKEATVILSDSLEMKSIDLYMQYDRPLTEVEIEKCRQSVIRRAKGEPSQYIRGLVEFLDCSFFVDSRVLIPRMETEILVDKIMKDIQNDDLSGKEFWDICTGSGCIGINIKKRFPELNVTLSDLSDDALAVAEDNAKNNGVKVRCVKGDLLKPFKGEMADFVVSNPPYINELEYKNLSAEVKCFEPKMALVSGKSGMEFYQRFNDELPKYLRPEAKVWMEIGFDQGESIVEIFSGPDWKNVRYEHDWGGHDRFFYAQLRKNA